MARCRLSRRAESESSKIEAYVARNSPARATTFMRELRQLCAHLPRFPPGCLRPTPLPLRVLHGARTIRDLDDSPRAEALDSHGRQRNILANDILGLVK